MRLVFFKQKTAYELRISDWSADVCSSDLAGARRRLCLSRGGGDTRGAGRHRHLAPRARSRGIDVLSRRSGMSFDPATVAAFVDGELDDLKARRIEREAANDAALAAEIARHRTLKAQLMAHYTPVAEEAVPERLRSLLAVDDQVDTSLTDRSSAQQERFSGVHRSEERRVGKEGVSTCKSRGSPYL